MKSQCRIAIFYLDYYLNSIPSLCNAARLLAAHGYWVDIFTLLGDDYLKPDFDNERISVLPCFPPPAAERVGSFRHWPRPLYWVMNLRARHYRIPYLCAIGVDPEGLMFARRCFTRCVRVPLAYYSLELLLSYEVSGEELRRRKQGELPLSRQAPFVIIQDEERAALLARDNGIPIERMILVPNAPLGMPGRRQSDLLRRKLGISSSKRIVLNTGSIGSWTGLAPLMFSTRVWPEDWLLVVHCGHGRVDKNYLAALDYLARDGRVVLSTGAIPFQEFPDLVASADIGVAFYLLNQSSAYFSDNLRYLGLSSGKLAYYLQAGLPVLVNDTTSLRTLVSQYRCGEVIGNVEDTRSALERIFADYDTYSRNALACFRTEMDVTRKFDAVLEALDRLR